MYDPKKAFVLSAEDKKRYQAISAEVNANKKADPKAAVEKINKVLAEVSTVEAIDDNIDEKNKDFVGIMLDGSSGSAISKGSLEASSDCVLELPRVGAAVEEEEDHDDDRSLWGDGEKDPAEADE